MSKIKIAIVGTGSIAQGSHLPSYAKMDDIEIVSVADIDYEKAKTVAEKYNIPKAFDSVEALLEGSDPDIVDVCVWPAAHAEVTITAANAGKNVICEKPTCDSIEKALAMRDAVRKNNVNFMLATPLRYMPAATYIRERVDAGDFGEVFYGKTAYVRQRGIPGGWFSCKKYAGGGPILDVGVHRIDLAWYCMGCPKPVSVSATASYRIGDYRDENRSGWNGADVPDYVFNTEDSSHGFIRFENGASLYFETSWSFNGPGYNFTQIAGDKAGATVDPLKIYRGNGREIIEETPEVTGRGYFDIELSHFVDCVRNDKVPCSDIEQAVMLEAILDGIYKSADAGCEIKLNF